ncbi:hypothetical protein NJ76_16150 [Rhodococcus sp. IITR03]|nr:hypothetical protein NJ76_16150 [Rhodococcus sp. IITR03]
MTLPPPPPPPLPPQQVPPPMPAHGYPQNRPQTNAMAIASFVTSFFVPVLAIIFGHIGLKQIRRNGDEGRGFAIAGLVIGYAFTAIGLAVIAMWAIALGTFANAIASFEDDDYSTYLASTTYTTQSYTTPSYSTITSKAAPSTTIRAGTAQSSQETSNAIRNAAVGSCIIHERGAQNSSGSYEVYVQSASCSDSASDFRVTARVTDTDDCREEWVRTTEPTVVLCLTPN